jgi:hypothetical protein
MTGSFLALGCSTSVFAQNITGQTRNPCIEQIKRSLNGDHFEAFSWDSPEFQARRMRAALSGDLSDSSKRIHILVNRAMAPHVKNAASRWPEKDILVALKELGTDAPRVHFTDHQLIYANLENGKVLIEDPLCGCFWFDRLKNSEISGFSDWDSAQFRHRKIFNYRPFLSSIVGDDWVQRQMLMGLSLAFGRKKNVVSKIDARARLLIHSPKTHSLSDAISQFLGSGYVFDNLGTKVRLINKELGTEILDDPYGVYFRIAADDKQTRFLDWDGKVVSTSPKDLSISHFNYGYFTEEHGLDLPQLQEALKSHTIDRRPRRHENPHLDLKKLQETAPVRAESGSSEDAFERAIKKEGQTIKGRAAALDELNWQSLSYEQKMTLLSQAAQYRRSSLDDIKNLVFEYEAYLRLAERSNDINWSPVLSKWARSMTRTKGGWTARFRIPLAKVLTEIREKAQKVTSSQFDTQSALYAIYNHDMPNVRRAALNSLAWKSIRPDDQTKILARAQHFLVAGPKENDSNFEDIIGSIGLARRSGDSRWIPVLLKWQAALKLSQNALEKARAGEKLSWQGQIYQKIQETIESLRPNDSAN